MQTSRGTRQLEMGMWMLNMQLNADKGVVWSSKSLKIGKTMYIGFFFKYLVWAHKTKCICIYMRNAYAHAYMSAHEKNQLGQL